MSEVLYYWCGKRACRSTIIEMSIKKLTLDIIGLK